MKGTYRTALEWAKVLLSINPVRDPYCMRLVIHHLAIRAHEFRWLLDLYNSKWAKESKGEHSPALNHITPSLAIAAMQLKEPVKCRELLADSMNKVPWLFFRLFKELDLDAPRSIWGIEPRTDSETLFKQKTCGIRLRPLLYLWRSRTPYPKSISARSLTSKTQR
jgi:hypothetical protein